MVSSDRERKKELLCGGMEKCMSEVIVVTSGFGASMIDTVEAVVNIDEHTMSGSGHDAALLCILLQHWIVGSFCEWS